MVEEDDWRPLGYDEGDAAAGYDALHEGIPQWLRRSLLEWFRYAISLGNGDYFDPLLFRSAERVLRVPLDYDGDSAWHATAVAERLGHFTFLVFIDFLLANDYGDANGLDRILHEAGSAWKVGTRAGRPGLVRRVPEGVQRNADRVMASSGRAGQRLAEAWEKIFGVQPDPSGAYALAVKAVEDAAIPVVVPNQAKATLGHVIGRLRDDGDGGLSLTREDPGAPTSEIVLRMCQALWKGHHDRHGGGDHAVPGVSKEEAETAVTLAVPLVQWFVSGMVARR
ncbi:hypothetical protein ACFP6A_05435 [Quadrisphaera sp. GCM10027208]|uniref:hypothetical protein n=1 Tax=Quadrisphaera sp. GCM10027208 TaxID=3273423 RepID=UPI00361FA6EF